MPEPTDPDVVACIAAGLHLTSCDNDGYCNHCGNQDGWDYDNHDWLPEYKKAVAAL